MAEEDRTGQRTLKIVKPHGSVISLQIASAVHSELNNRHLKVSYGKAELFLKW